MPPSIIHIAFGILFMLIFLAGTVFPDFELVFQKGFFKNKYYNGFFEEPDCSKEPVFSGILHSAYLWIGVVLFGLGCLLHISMDWYFI